MRAQREQLVSTLCHLFNAFPVYGLVFSGCVWYALREESRAVVRHAQQAMIFHTPMLAALLVWLLMGLIVKLVQVISPLAGFWLKGVNDLLITVLILIYICICLVGAVRTFRGQNFDYPLVRVRS